MYKYIFPLELKVCLNLRVECTVSRASCIWQNENGSCEGPKLKMLVKFHRSNGSFPNTLNWWRIRFGCTALDECYWNKENWFANWKSTMHFSDLHILVSTMPLIIEFFYQNKKPIWKILRTDKNNNFKFTIKFLMTLERWYIGYLGFLGTDLFKSVLMYSNVAICLIKLLFKMGLFTVCQDVTSKNWRWWIIGAIMM
jgi:hypothetical protein